MVFLEFSVDRTGDGRGLCNIRIGEGYHKQNLCQTGQANTMPTYPHTRKQHNTNIVPTTGVYTLIV